MEDIIVYSFEDEYGEQVSDWKTLKHSEAVSFAEENDYRVVENTYHWVDSQIVDDFTNTDEEEDEEDEPNISDEEIQEHIDNGVRVLDAYYGGESWRWANRVPIHGYSEDFDIDSPSRCTLHYVFKDEPLLNEEERRMFEGGKAFYSLGIARLNFDGSAESHGFQSVDGEGDRLTEMWKETIFRLQDFSMEEDEED